MESVNMYNSERFPQENLKIEVNIEFMKNDDQGNDMFQFPQIKD